MIFHPGQGFQRVGAWLAAARCAMLVLGGAWGSAFAQAANFSASLDRTTIAVGESATLSFSFEGGTPKRMPGFQAPTGVAIQPLGQGRQITIVNGQTTSVLSYNYQVTASRPGDYVIPSIEVEMDNNQMAKSQSLTLRVTKASSTPGALAFLKLIPSKDTVYVGESFPVEIQLYLGARQDSLQMPQIEGDGFMFGKISQPTQSNAQSGNQLYTVGTFRVSAVAVKTGQLTMGPVQCSMVLHVPVNARSRSIFDDVFGGGVQRKQVTLSSDPQVITVLPLPTRDQPPNFNGAVGNFTLAAKASPTNLLAGDPITVRVQIAGQGNLDALPFPGGTDWPGFKLYPPSSKVETSDPLGMSGVKTFERVVIAQNPDIKEVPGILFSFFDPEQKAYRALQSGAIPIAVKPSEGGSPQPTVLAGSRQGEESAAVVRDIVHIKPYLGTVVGLQPPLVLRPWFLAVQGIPLVIWIAALAFRRRREAWAKNPRLRRRVRVAEVVRNGVRELARLAQAQESDSFFAAVFRLLQEQLGERLDLPSSAITEAVIDDRLRRRASEDLVAELHALFQVCNQARYGPHRSKQELMAVVPRVESALRQLGQLPDVVPN